MFAQLIKIIGQIGQGQIDYNNAGFYGSDSLYTYYVDSQKANAEKEKNENLKNIIIISFLFLLVLLIIYKS